MRLKQNGVTGVALLIAMSCAVIVSAKQNNSTLSWMFRVPELQEQAHASDATARGPETGAPVHRYGVIWPGKLTRSGVPKGDEGWRWLRAQGINSVINFRQRNEVDYKSYGFTNSLWMPLHDNRKPTAKEVDSYLAWIQEPSNQPVHIQCAEGKDRTGMMAALVRYALDGWSMDDAINEASLYRKGKPLSDDRIKWLREWASAHPPGSERRK